MIDALQLSFPELVEPTELTTGLAIVLAVLIFVVPWLGIRIRSGYIITVWSITMVILVISFITEMSFIYFWFFVILSVVVISINVMYVFHVDS